MIKSMFTSITASFLIIATVSAQQSSQSPGVESSADVATQASQLATAIMSEIGDRAQTASVADLEGIIVFVVSQGDYSAEVIDAALASLEATATGNLLQAIKNARKSLAANGTGTGAVLSNNGGIGGGGGGGGFDGGLAAPGVGSGGGAVDYTT